MKDFSLRVGCHKIKVKHVSIEELRDIYNSIEGENLTRNERKLKQKFIRKLLKNKNLRLLKKIKL